MIVTICGTTVGQVCILCCCIECTTCRVLCCNLVNLQCSRILRLWFWLWSNYFALVDTSYSDCSLLVAYLVVIVLVAENVAQLVVTSCKGCNCVGVVFVSTACETIVVITCYNIVVCVQNINTKQHELVVARCVLEVDCYITVCWCGNIQRITFNDSCTTVLAAVFIGFGCSYTFRVVVDFGRRNL